MSQLNALLAVVGRNLRLARRRVDLLVQTTAVPVVVLGLASIIYGASDAWPVAVVDESGSVAAQGVVRALDETRGATGPYFDTITTDAQEADDLLRSGRLQLVVTIPEDFDRTQEVRASTFNINTDTMKNVRLRLTTAANVHDALAGVGGVTATTVKERPEDVPRTAFMGGSAVIVALLLGAALISANLYAVETEHRTRKEIALSPLGAHLAAAGAAVAGWLLSFVTAVPTLLLALAFGTWATAADVAQTALLVLPAGLACAGVGVLVAIGLRTHRLIQPTLILLALGSFFASGGLMSVSAMPPLARAVADWWPVSAVFEWSNPVLHGFVDAPSAAAVGAVLGVAVVAFAAAMPAARRDYRHAHVQGQ